VYGTGNRSLACEQEAAVARSQKLHEVDIEGPSVRQSSQLGNNGNPYFAATFIFAVNKFCYNFSLHFGMLVFQINSGFKSESNRELFHYIVATGNFMNLLR
jgi:hypothetical protein